MKTRSIFTDEYLSHHGIQGQKWGIRNGPPYPLSNGPSSPAEIQKAKDEINSNPGAKKMLDNLDVSNPLNIYKTGMHHDAAGQFNDNHIWSLQYAYDGEGDKIRSGTERGYHGEYEGDPFREAAAKDHDYIGKLNDKIWDIMMEWPDDFEDWDAINPYNDKIHNYVRDVVLPRYASHIYELLKQDYEVGDLSPMAESYLRSKFNEVFLSDDMAEQALWDSDDNTSDSYAAVDDNDFDEYFMLRHHGINGQKWGVQNGPPYPLRSGQRSSAEETKTGIVSKSAKKLRSFTEFAGRSVKNGIKNRVESYKQKRAEKKEHDKMVKEQTKAAKKASAHVDFTNMTTQEIREATARLNAQNAYEQEYNKLHPQKPKGNVMKDIGTNTLKTLTKAGTDALAEAGKEVGKQFLSETLGEAVNKYLGYDVVDTKRVKEAGEVDGMSILRQIRSGMIKPESLTTKQLNATEGILNKFKNLEKYAKGDSDEVNVAKVLHDIETGKLKVEDLSVDQYSKVSGQTKNYNNLKSLIASPGTSTSNGSTNASTSKKKKKKNKNNASQP